MGFTLGMTVSVTRQSAGKGPDGIRVGELARGLLVPGYAIGSIFWRATLQSVSRDVVREALVQGWSQNLLCELLPIHYYCGNWGPNCCFDKIYFDT